MRLKIMAMNLKVYNLCQSKIYKSKGWGESKLKYNSYTL